MKWSIHFLPEAEDDLKRLDAAIRVDILKTIQRVSVNPDVDGYGKPLGNMGGSNLNGLMKIKFKKSGIRAVYKLIRAESEMKIIVISARADGYVYKLAEKRRQQHNL